MQQPEISIHPLIGRLLKKARKYATFRYLFLFPRHQNNRLNMSIKSKHIPTKSQKYI